MTKKQKKQLNRECFALFRDYNWHRQHQLMDQYKEVMSLVENALLENLKKGASAFKVDKKSKYSIYEYARIHNMTSILDYIAEDKDGA